jgi:hypothetical protein
MFFGTYFLLVEMLKRGVDVLMSQAADNYDLLPRQLSFKHAVQI